MQWKVYYKQYNFRGSCSNSIRFVTEKWDKPEAVDAMAYTRMSETKVLSNPGSA